jgi:ATP-dependent RNA helicase DDX18/HAS1
MGGANKNTEEQKIKKGISIVTATPGRLLDHLATNANFLYKNLQLLIIDEADRCLEIGFEEEMYQIINTLPKNRQTVLFSATQTKNIQSLSRVSFKKEPIYLGVDDMSVNSSIPEIDQNFLICRPEDRFIILISLLKKNITSKIIVFFSSCNEVKFFSNLANLIGLNVLDLHGKQKQFKRSSTFFDFCKAKNSILFSTDIASRGLDIPSVDWIFHLDAPLEAKEYFHRVGRTCRGINSFGKSLIFLLPTEINFLKFLENNKIKINEYKFRVHDWSIIHYRISNLIEQNSYLIKMAKEALRSFLNSYSSSNMKEVFDIKKINLNSLSKNFGLNTKSNLIL